MALVGIDLGTTNSLITVFTDDGPQLIPNALGEVLTPSAVGVSDTGDIIVGAAAKNRLVSHPEQTYARFKRYMGANRQVKMGKKTYRAEELSALVLRSLKDDAERHLGEPVDRAIISVPAYFNDVQRKATYAAGKMAGLTVERLINEPTAAALAYGLNSKEDENTFLVIDLGGGTFDVSILEIFEGVMEVRSSAGDAFLGGEDFTDAIVGHFCEQLETKPEDLKPGVKGLLRDLADKAKMQLSSHHEAGVNFIDRSAKKPAEQKLTITREKFESLTEGLIKRMRRPIQRAIMDADLRADDIDRVVMVGGATRMPVVRAMITRLLKLFPEHSLDPDHVIALGAAVQCGLLERHAVLEDVVMTDVAPFTLGTEITIETRPGHYESGHFQPIIERNTVIPVSRVVTNSTMQKGQKQVNIEVYQGESPMVASNVKLGAFQVAVPHNPKGHEAFDIRFTYDVSGILEVIVTTLSDDKTKTLVIEGNPGSIPKEEIAKRFKALEKLKIHPRDAAENTALISRFERAYENSLGDLRQHIGQNLAAFQGILDKQNETDIKVAREEFSEYLTQIENMDVF